MKQNTVTINNICMAQKDFHRICQISIANNLRKKLRLEYKDFRTMSTEDIESYICKCQSMFY